MLSCWRAIALRIAERCYPSLAHTHTNTHAHTHKRTRTHTHTHTPARPNDRPRAAATAIVGRSIRAGGTGAAVTGLRTAAIAGAGILAAAAGAEAVEPGPEVPEPSHANSPALQGAQPAPTTRFATASPTSCVVAVPPTSGVSGAPERTTSAMVACAPRWMAADHFGSSHTTSSGRSHRRAMQATPRRVT